MWKSVYSYYGGKSKIVDCYPAPRHELIIEPFAGAAAYAWKYRHHRVWLNDLDERTASIWEFLLSPDAYRWVERYWPTSVSAGERSSDYFSATAPAGMVELFRAEANQGTQGARGVHDQVTSMGATCWPRTRRKLLEIIPQIAHWKFTRRDYRSLAYDLPATWFIDPPYSNPAGRRYRTGGLDYPELANWCQSRAGQVVVCENAGASWLPFEPLEHRRVSIRSRYQLADAKEMMWQKET